MTPIQKLNTVLELPNLGLLILRLWLGVIGFYHGAWKLFGLFGGAGIKGFSEMLAKMDVPMPQVSAVLAGTAELAGGVLIAIGLFTRLSALVFAFNMGVAIYLVHRHAFSNMDNGFEFPATVLAGLVTVAFVGPGRFSLDSVIGRAVAAVRIRP